MAFTINGADVTQGAMTKSQFIDLYPSLSNVIITPTLFTCGYNGNGQLGNNTATNKTSPVQTVSAGTNWKYISANWEKASFGIKTDGTLWSWGRDDYGQLGDNTTTNKSSPVQTVSGGTNWAFLGQGGRACAAAIKTDGTLWLWGRGEWGQMGNNATAHKSSPVQTIAGGTNWKQVALGDAHNSAIKTDGTLWSWGYNNSGQLGDNSTGNKSSPVQTVSAGTSWKQVTCGAYFTLALKTDGTIWGFGQNTSGELGDNTAVSKSSPVQAFLGGTDWKQVSTGYNHSAAIKSDGTLWMTGKNNYGQLGNGGATNKSSPVQTTVGGSNWKQVSCGKQTTSAIKTDGTLWFWGYNANYIAGLDGVTGANKSSPVQVVGGGTNWKQTACGYGHLLAIAENNSSL